MPTEEHIETDREETVEQRLARANAEAAELLAELESKHDELAAANRNLAQANSCSAELLAELEEKNELLANSNDNLARANVRSAELVAELEEKNELLGRSNDNLARANARSAELVAELQARREEMEWINTGLRQANEETKRVLGVVAHDVRSGLSGIHGFSDLLEDHLASSDPEAASRASMIRDEARRLIDLLESLLSEASSRLGREKLRLATLNLEELVEASVEIQNGQAIRKGQRIAIRGTQGGLELDADPVRIRQVLDNLISNAVKYGPPGSDITIELLREGGQVGVAVLDRGPGLTGEDLERVFGEFCQLSAKPTGGEESHGLGLSIAKKIVEQHGGRIWAENRGDEQGARFGFLLPAAVGRMQLCRILVVDNEPMMRRLVGELLKRFGHRVEMCEDGRSALEAVQRDHYDLVMMDVEMPVMDGRETALAIRAMGRDEEHLPIIAVTGHSDPAILSECLDSRMNDTIIKPVTAQNLKVLLRKWARRRVPCPAAD